MLFRCKVMTVIAVIIYIFITSYRSDRIFFTQSELQASVVLLARDYGIPQSSMEACDQVDPRTWTAPGGGVGSVWCCWLSLFRASNSHAQHGLHGGPLRVARLETARSYCVAQDASTGPARTEPDSSQCTYTNFPS